MPGLWLNPLAARRLALWYSVRAQMTAGVAFAALKPPRVVVGIQVPGLGRALLAAGPGGDDRGALRAGSGVFGESEDVPGDVGAGHALHGEPVAGLNVAGKRAIGELDRAHRVPVEPARGHFLFHRAQVLADAAEVRRHRGAEETEQQPWPGAHEVVGWSHAGGTDRDQPGGRCGVFHRGDEGAG